MRCAGIASGAETLPPLIVCNEAHRFAITEQAAELNMPIQPLILEPVGRNTAPALTVAALTLLDQGHDPALLALPADHVMEKNDMFQQAIKTGIELVRKQFIVTFGVDPTGPETGYGYIKPGAEIPVSGSGSAFHLADFTEKPDAGLAERYVQCGLHLWNSGIFMMPATVWTRVLELLQAEMFRACYLACRDGEARGNFFWLAQQAFAGCPGESIDNAIMEKLTAVNIIKSAVIPLDVGWSDIGAWDKVWEQGEADENNNVKIGDVVTNDTTNSLLLSSKRLVAASGCDNLAVIETADATLVLNKDNSQHIRTLVHKLNELGRAELIQGEQVQRPWGSYKIIERGTGYQVKKLLILPGKRISLQLHRKRSEHWVVASGTATVTRGEETFNMIVNQSTFIPPGMKHRLENSAVSALEIIEVQIGEYIGEDDITRFQDDFERTD